MGYDHGAGGHRPTRREQAGQWARQPLAWPSVPGEPVSRADDECSRDEDDRESHSVLLGIVGNDVKRLMSTTLTAMRRGSAQKQAYGDVVGGAPGSCLGNDICGGDDHARSDEDELDILHARIVAARRRGGGTPSPVRRRVMYCPSSSRRRRGPASHRPEEASMSARRPRARPMTRALDRGFRSPRPGGVRVIDAGHGRYPRRRAAARSAAAHARSRARHHDPLRRSRR